MAPGTVHWLVIPNFTQMTFELALHVIQDPRFYLTPADTWKYWFLVVRPGSEKGREGEVMVQGGQGSLHSAPVF